MKNYRLNITLNPDYEKMLRNQSKNNKIDMSAQIRFLIKEEDKRQKKRQAK